MMERGKSLFLLTLETLDDELDGVISRSIRKTLTSSAMGMC